MTEDNKNNLEQKVEKCKWLYVFADKDKESIPHLCRNCNGYNQDCPYYWGKKNIFGFEKKESREIL